MKVIFYTDGYKIDHSNQYPKGTTCVFTNFTARSNMWYPEATDGHVVFGLQYFVQKYLVEAFDEFFKADEDEAVTQFQLFVDSYLGPNNVDVERIRTLHKLGYLPIELRGLPEGSLCPFKVPCLSVINTHPSGFWIPNFLETLLSAVLWLPMTSATSARLFRKRMKKHFDKVGIPVGADIRFLCHDFSMRGMAGLEAAILSGMGHLTSFIGSETIPAIVDVKKYYPTTSFVAGTVPATEHSVMCAGGFDDEFETFKRLITEVYPEGFISIVSDTWDYWKVLTDYLPRLKDEIMARNGRVVIRPDSGDPVKIICGDPDAPEGSPERKGSYQVLWDLFGGTTNERGFKELDPHIGLIYGDSINLDRQDRIYEGLESQGFSSSNLVLGIGSYTYQYKSRDSLGFAMKATWCKVNGDERQIFKSPKTDSGFKKSLKGLFVVNEVNGTYEVKDQLSYRDYLEEMMYDSYITYFKDGAVPTPVMTLDDVRANVEATI